MSSKIKMQKTIYKCNFVVYNSNVINLRSGRNLNGLYRDFSPKAESEDISNKACAPVRFGREAFGCVSANVPSR